MAHRNFGFISWQKEQYRHLPVTYLDRFFMVNGIWTEPKGNEFYSTRSAPCPHCNSISSFVLDECNGPITHELGVARAWREICFTCKKLVAPHQVLFVWTDEQRNDYLRNHPEHFKKTEGGPEDNVPEKQKKPTKPFAGITLTTFNSMNEEQKISMLNEALDTGKITMSIDSIDNNGKRITRREKVDASDTLNALCRRYQRCESDVCSHVIVAGFQAELNEKGQTVISRTPVKRNRDIEDSDEDAAEWESLAKKKVKREETESTSFVITFSSRSLSYGFLSTCSQNPITIDGLTYPTAEHYYQSQKFKDTSYQEVIRKAETPRDAKILASQTTVFGSRGRWIAIDELIVKHRNRGVKPRPDWNNIKEKVMRRALKAKFNQSILLRVKLLNTGKSNLINLSDYDSYWGAGKDGKGKNRLGELLMELRAELST